MAYGAYNGRESAQSGSFDGRVANLRGGLDCPVVGDPVCLQVEMIALVDAGFSRSPGVAVPDVGSEELGESPPGVLAGGGERLEELKTRHADRPK